MADTAGRISADVLMVEDDPADVLMIQEAFEQYAARNTLHVVPDGEQALQFLRQEGRFSGVPRPGLVLLDLNLPRRNRPGGPGRDPGRSAAASRRPGSRGR